MNIVYFTHEKEYGGSSRALVSLIEEIKKYNDVNIYVIVPFKDSKIIPELKKMNINIITCFYSWWQIPIHVSFIKKLLFRIVYLYNIIAILKIKHMLKNVKIDIIHSNTSVIDIGAKFANKINVPHVWHFREFTANNLEFIKGQKKSFNYINKYGGNIIYISKIIKEFYVNNIKENNTKIIYDGLPGKIINKKNEYEKKDKINFLIAGTLQENKGQHLAIRAFNQLKKKGYKNIKLYIAGGDPNGYLKYLKSLIKEYNIENDVEYLGFVKNMTEIRKKVDIELLCSESEAFGLVVVEAMLAGNVIIASNSGATSEIIKDNENGYLYKCGDYKDLSLKMEKIINNPDLLEEIGVKGQKYAIDNFLSKKSAKNVIEYYYEIRRGK